MKQSDWSSEQYLKFQSQRTRPAVDLARRVAGYHPTRIADIGCGPGNSTRVLREQFPQAELLGIDNSPDMIEKARSHYPQIRFELCDALSLEGGYDLLFSNACLQWIPDHEQLLPALMEKLNPGGVLAVQIPVNGAEPLFQLIDRIVGEPEWELAEAEPRSNNALEPEAYFTVLSRCSVSFEIWETKYFHSLPNHRALVEWVKGARLRPYLDALGTERGRQLEERIAEEARALYPVMENGEIVLGFRRLFFTAIR